MSAQMARRIELRDVARDRADQPVGERGEREGAERCEKGEETKLPKSAARLRGRLVASPSQPHEGRHCTGDRMAYTGCERNTGALVGARTPPLRSTVTATIAPVGTRRGGGAII